MAQKIITQMDSAMYYAAGSYAEYAGVALHPAHKDRSGSVQLSAGADSQSGYRSRYRPPLVNVVRKLHFTIWIITMDVYQASDFIMQSASILLFHHLYIFRRGAVHFTAKHSMKI